MTYLNPQFNDLPMLQIITPVTDDDIDFHSDMHYMRDLLNAIIIQAANGGHCGPWPGDLTTHFTWLEDQFNA